MDENKIKVIDINNAEELVSEATKTERRRTSEQMNAIEQAKKKTEKEKREQGILQFTKKEIEKMPRAIRKLFKVHGLTARVRRTNDNLYQIRCRSKGYNIQITRRDFDECKTMFLKSLEEHLNDVSTDTGKKRNSSVLLTEYMQTWLDTVKKPSIKLITFNDYQSIFNAHISSIFEGRTIRSITRQELQSVINEFFDDGKNRTAGKIYQLLKSVFSYAVADDIIDKSPMERVVLPKYEQVRGTALTIEEEKEFVKKAYTTPYGDALVFILYTGLRRSELSSVTIDGKWVRLVSAKQRKGATEKIRSIPITPMLESVLPKMDINAMKTVNCTMFTKWVKNIMPNHHCHDLRHTFITRCQECGVPTPIVSLWAGHSIAGIDSSITVQVYSHYSEETQLQESLKVRY